MPSFTADISRWIAQTKLDGVTVVRKLALDAYAGILQRSIVDTGRFRASHRLSLGSLDPTVEPPREGGPSMRDTLQFQDANPNELAAANSTLNGARWGDTVIISNSLPYAKKLEDGGSAQNGFAEDGIYGETFAEMLANLDRAIREALRDA